MNDGHDCIYKKILDELINCDYISKEAVEDMKEDLR